MGEQLQKFLSAIKFVDGLDWSQVKLVLTLLAVVLGLFALAALTYMVQTALSPLTRIVQWMFAYTPGSRPNDFAAGLAQGLRLFVWSGLIALILWFLFR